MPVKIDTIQAKRTRVVEESLPADHVWIATLNVDASDHATAPATMRFDPYAIIDGAPVFASDPIQVKTADLFKVAARIPAVAEWLKIGFEATQAMLADIAAKQPMLDKANAVLADAKAAKLKATEARAAAFSARKDANDPVWIEADAAWIAAGAAITQAQALVTATTAALDPANEPLA